MQIWISDEDIKEAAKLSYCEEFIRTSNKYEIFGENGIPIRWRTKNFDSKSNAEKSPNFLMKYLIRF